MRRRWALAPLAYARLWHQDAPRTSQREALRRLCEPGVMMLLLLGGNRSGKSAVMAMWAIATAAGYDAYIETRHGRFYWVQAWLSANGLPASLIRPGNGRVWVGSPTFGAAVEQIRPHLRRYAPHGTEYQRWDDKLSEGELSMPGGGVVVSKAYKQYKQDSMTWEGAALRGLGLDEQPGDKNNVFAGMSRLVDHRGQCLWSVTPLRGKSDYLYTDFYCKSADHRRVYHIHGGDNPHIPQDHLELMISSMPEWQRDSRRYGLFGSPEGLIYKMWNPDVHVVGTFVPPATWTRWVGVDWGARNPHIVWAAEDECGALWVYRELYFRRTATEPGIPVSKLIAMAKEAECAGDSVDPLCLVYRTADSEDPGAIEEAAGQGWLCAPVDKGAGSVEEGINLVDALISTRDPQTMEPVKPRLFVMASCPGLISELGEYRWAEGKEGVRPDPTCSDHGCDALRYLVRYRASMGLT